MAGAHGVAAGKGVLELIGNDVAAFCDNHFSAFLTLATTLTSKKLRKAAT